MTLYGFFHCSCVYESAPGLVSLHATKKGALKAMIAHQWDGWVEERSPKRTHLHMGNGWHSWANRLKWYENQEWRVCPVEVQP